MEEDMAPWLKPQIEEEWYMNSIPPHTEELIPNLQNHTQQQNNVGPSDPNTSVFKHHLGSSFSLPSPKSNFSNLLNINDNININGSTTNNKNDNNNPFGSVFNLESQGFSQTPLSIPRLTLTWLNGFEKKMRKDENGEVEKGLNYNSNESVDAGKMRNHEKNADNNYNSNTIIDNFDDENCVSEGDRKGKKKENPSKSLIAERKRRKKLKNNMHKLRSVVPKISKVSYS
ncbi:putative transcription factor bHLH family [Medicago truncatula]|uniref:Putative transcription factor bHLH family n=1 Tax=Medicago truncatula TaxID=3880 RepID=A0A396IKN3_MEDTR|nr:putative transcription factor bHLH family [Medicago truncatula]